MKQILIPALLCAAMRLPAQPLTPEMAVEKAYNANFGLASLKAMCYLAAAQNTWGNAGAAPQVGLSGNWAVNRQNASLKFNNGSEVSRKGAGSNALTGGLNITQPLFDGFGIFATKNRLEMELESAVERKRLFKAELREQVLNAYFLLLRETQWLRQLQSLDTFYQLKLSNTRLLYENGRVSYADVLQAEADLLQQQVRTAERSLMLKSATQTLNLLMAEKADKTWTLALTAFPENLVLPDTSATSLEAGNPRLRQMKADLEAARFRTREAKADLYPTLQAGMNLNLLRSSNDVGILLSNRTTGTGFSLGLSYPLYSGGAVHRNMRVGSIMENMAEYAYQQALLESKSQLHLALVTLQTLQQQVSLQEQTTEKLKELVKITAASYNLGQAGRVELVQTQSAYDTALTSLMELQYRKMLAYHALWRLLAAE